MRILLISNFFPPVNSIAAHRIYSFAKYFPEFGIDIEVLTPKRKGTLDFDLGGRTIHFPCEENKDANKFTKRQNWLKNVLKYSGIRSWRYYLTSKFYHSSKIILEADFLGRFDAVLASFGNEDALRLAYYVHRKSGLPLIIDYRDLWYDNHHLNWTPLDRLVIYMLEKRIIKKAALVSTVSKNLSAQLAKRYGVNAAVVYNGYFDLVLELSVEKRDFVQSDVITFCYCGSLYGGVRPVQEIFPLLSQNSNYVLNIAVFDDVDRHLIKSLAQKHDVENQLHVFHNLSYRQAIALEKQSDYLLFLNRLDGLDKGVLTGKLFEYIALGKPIVGFGHSDDEAGELIREYHLGCYCSSAQELSHWIEQKQTAVQNENKMTSFFNRKAQARVLAQLIKERISFPVVEKLP